MEASAFVEQNRRSFVYPATVLPEEGDEELPVAEATAAPTPAPVEYPVPVTAASNCVPDRPPDNTVTNCPFNPVFPLVKPESMT
jgi:hypothetical protein